LAFYKKGKKKRKRRKKKRKEKKTEGGEKEKKKKNYKKLKQPSPFPKRPETTGEAWIYEQFWSQLQKAVCDGKRHPSARIAQPAETS